MDRRHHANPLGRRHRRFGEEAVDGSGVGGEVGVHGSEDLVYVSQRQAQHAVKLLRQQIALLLLPLARTKHRTHRILRLLFIPLSIASLSLRGFVGLQVDFHVGVEVAAFSEGPSAAWVSAGVGLFPGVDSQVDLQRGRPHEPVSAHFALVGPLVGVRP